MAGTAALGDYRGQLAASQQAQGFTGTEGQAIPLTAEWLEGHTVLVATGLRALGPGFVAALITVLRQPSLHIDTADQAPLDSTTTVS